MKVWIVRLQPHTFSSEWQMQPPSFLHTVHILLYQGKWHKHSLMSVQSLAVEVLLKFRINAAL